MVARRGAKKSREAYHSGLRWPLKSTAAQETTGQSSLSCQIKAPALTGSIERMYSTPKRMACACCSWHAQCQSSMSDQASVGISQSRVPSGP